MVREPFDLVHGWLVGWLVVWLPLSRADWTCACTEAMVASYEPPSCAGRVRTPKRVAHCSKRARLQLCVTDHARPPPACASARSALILSRLSADSWSAE